MNIKNAIVNFSIIIILVPILNHANGGVVSDELVPATDLYSLVVAPDPYYVTLRELLVGEHRYRKCQIVAIPSFQNEWAVYLIRNNGKSRLIVKVLKKHLWTEMMREISDDGKKESYSVNAKTQTIALSKLSKQVERHSISISERTADALEKAWELILARVRYKDEGGLGLDGISYHVSHWNRGIGSWSGTTWSPKKGTLPADLVAIGYLLKELVGLSEKEIKSKENDIKISAKHLIEKITRLKN